jgi:hypothetical protein
MRLPNFFVVGTPKAGTTALYHYLAQHPGIYMSPIKEPAFFAPDLFQLKNRLGTVEVKREELLAYLDGPMIERRSGVINEWELYLKLFKKVRHEAAIGEVSANYLGSSCAPQAIREAIPEAKIIMILRDPVDRLYSQYSEAAAEGQAGGDFLAWVEEQQTDEERLQPRLGAVWNGFYARHVHRYREHFPENQIRIYLYSEYRRAPLTTLREIFTFLGVEPDFPADVSRRHNVTLQPRSLAIQNATAPIRRILRKTLPAGVRDVLRSRIHRPPRRLTRHERAAILKIYEDDIRELQTLLHRDFSDWLEETSQR